MAKKEYLLKWVLRAQKIARLGFWDLDPVSNEFWWSDETFRILGLKPQSIIPGFDVFLERVLPDDRRLIIRQTELALISDENPYEVEYRIMRPDGTERIIHEEVLVERDKTGVPQKITGIIQDITECRRAQKEREELIEKLQNALNNVKALSGLLPICVHCKSIRDDQGYWNQIEVYLERHSEAEFSHGICKRCAKKYYPDMDIYPE